MVFIIELKPDVEMQSDSMSKKYCFAIRDEPGALAKALLVFNVGKLMIVTGFVPLIPLYNCTFYRNKSLTLLEFKICV